MVKFTDSITEEVAELSKTTRVVPDPKTDLIGAPDMITKRVSAKALVFVQLLLSGIATSTSQAELSKIEFRPTLPPVVVSGIPMKHAVASHTDTEFIGNFIAPEGTVVCKMDLDNLSMTGPTVPIFNVSLAAANSIRYNVAAGTSPGPFWGLTRVNDKPTAMVTVQKPSRSRSSSALTTDCLHHMARCARPSSEGKTRPYFSVRYISAPNTDSAVRVMTPRCRPVSGGCSR